MTPDWRKYDVTPNLNYLDQSPVFTEQINYLVRRFNWEIKLEKCEKNLAACERDLALNKLTSARKFLEVSKRIVEKIPNNKAIDHKLGRIKQKIEMLEKVH